MILILLVIVMCILFLWLSVDYKIARNTIADLLAADGDYHLFCILSTDKEKLARAHAQLHNKMTDVILDEEDDVIYNTNDAVFLFSDGEDTDLRINEIVNKIEGLAKLYLIVDKGSEFLWGKTIEDLDMYDNLVKSTVVDLDGGLFL